MIKLHTISYVAKKVLSISLLVGTLALLGSCCLYRMPADEDYSVVPTTNNPSVTREGNRTCLPVPGIGY